MNIKKNTVVSFDYTLKDSKGHIIDSSEGREPLSYLHGKGALIPGLEAALDGKSKGDSFKVTIEAAEGYGVRNEDLIREVERSEFELEDIVPGMQFQADTEDGTIIFTVIKADDDNVLLDGNHPLAGIQLHFQINVTELREATKEEVEHGHIHGADGHHHDH